MQRFTLFLAIGLAVMVSLAQPGICPCWMLSDVRQLHPHLFNQPQTEHSHQYLLEYNQTVMAQVVPALVPQVTLLVALLSLAGLSWRIESWVDLPAGWASSPESPPPEFRLT